MSQPLLAIAIPTYKRPDQLRRCVRSAIKAAAPFGVPIVVADDSTDETNLAVMAELRAAYPHLEHHRNPRNLGIDGNILHSVDLCEARHVWIMGEDDRLVPQAVARVVEVLNAGPRPFVYVNYASVDESLRLVLKERSLTLAADTDEPAEVFLAEHAWSMGFIGACVVDRALWGTVEKTRYLGTWFAHCGTILEYLHGRQVHLIAEPLVLNRCGAPGAFTWSSSTFDVLGGWARMVALLRDRYPAEACDRADASFVKAHGLGTIPFFAYLRAGGALDRESYLRFVKGGPYPAAGRAAAWAMARLDRRLFRAAAWAFGAVRSLRNRHLAPEA
jgi:glycosyltransferase involved in cell wall biosynthesis